MEDTRRKLLENFDAEVHDRLKINMAQSKEYLDRYARMLWAVNVINRENDRMSGRRPIEFIQAANPIVIIDEPQSVDTTEKSRRAIGNLNPMVTLRYSATHRTPTTFSTSSIPIKAYDLRLVKRIEVASVRSDEQFQRRLREAAQDRQQERHQGPASKFTRRARRARSRPSSGSSRATTYS